LLIDREDLVKGDKIEDSEDGVKIANCEKFFVNYIDCSTETFAEDNKVGDGENDIEIADCADFFLINYINRGAEDFAENNENNIGIADCEKFFLNYIDRCAILLYFANLIIDKAASEIANTY
jgi:hypothetical protein